MERSSWRWRTAAGHGVELAVSSLLMPYESMRVDTEFGTKAADERRSSSWRALNLIGFGETVCIF